MDAIPRFNSVEDWHAFQDGDRSKAIWPYIYKDGKAQTNPDYLDAQYGLIVTKLSPSKIVNIP